MAAVALIPVQKKHYLSRHLLSMNDIQKKIRKFDILGVSLVEKEAVLKNCKQVSCFYTLLIL